MSRRSSSWEPDVWITLESAGTHARFRRVGHRWLIESLRLASIELLPEDRPLVDANPGLVQYLEGLANTILEDPS